MRLVIAAAALVASSTLAIAGEEVMSGYFGNTVIATSPMGEMKVRYKPDHTFSGRAKGPMGNYDISGTWKLDTQGNLCRKYVTNGADLPPGTPNPYCAPVQAHKPGDSWQVTENGRTADVKLIEGR
jgi:hypothetical protein